ncbi:MAG: shikimate kinase [Deltaproteobacteria bacterium]|nr:shikimate kinase [Deltaproteobacteria bacterium]
MNVVLIGYRCTGKSSVGRKLSERLGVPFYDTDDLIENRVGKSIRQMVAEHGWPFFREREKEIIGQLATVRGGVIATGGGAVLDDENRHVLKKMGVCVWLSADTATILQRMKADASNDAQRPSLSNKDLQCEVTEGLGEREPLYRDLAHLSIDTADRGTEEVVETICQFLTVC